VVIHWLEKMAVQKWLDEELPNPHGNRQGLSYGQLAVLLLTYIISQSDHRLCAVEPWVKAHHQSLEGATGWQIDLKDATDDRLADLLKVLGSSEEQVQEKIAPALGQHLIRAYELPTKQGRSDTSSFSVYHQAKEKGEGGNLLNFGYSKDHRPDLRQYRQMLATLDPLGLPLLGITLAGEGGDEAHYLPTWRQLKKIMGQEEFLFLADCKAATWANRAILDREGGKYCFPLSMSKPRPQILETWLDNPPTEVRKIFRDERQESSVLRPEKVESGDESLPRSDTPIGEGFEMMLGSLWLDEKTGDKHHWSERWLVVCSYSQRERLLKGFSQRLQKAEQDLKKLVDRPGKDALVLEKKVAEILQRYRVNDYIYTSIESLINYEKVYEKEGRPSRKSPSHRQRQITLKLSYHQRLSEIARYQNSCGWRLYVTNATPEQLSLEEAVLAYREQWQPERGFHRFKRGLLPALPIYFQDDDKIRGLMFLLTIALQVFTLMEFVVRRELANGEQSLAGLYDGNPKRATERPTAERLLSAFAGLTLYLHRDGSREITGLNSLQERILTLMQIPLSLYTLPSPAPT
jgi:transposase